MIYGGYTGNQNGFMSCIEFIMSGYVFYHYIVNDKEN